MGKKGNGKEEEELMSDLLERDQEFKKAHEIHRDYENRLAEIDKRVYLTTEDQIERKKLQKLKLIEKDKMEEIIQRYKGDR